MTMINNIKVGTDVTLETLREAGVRWPAASADHKPRHSVHRMSSGGQDAFEFGLS